MTTASGTPTPIPILAGVLRPPLAGALLDPLVDVANDIVGSVAPAEVIADVLVGMAITDVPIATAVGTEYAGAKDTSKQIF